jgi:hypothetical protein
MPLVEVQERDDILPGTYHGIVQSVAKDIIVPKQGKNAGQDVPVLRWVWSIPDANDSIESITGRDPSSEKSNLFKYFVALLGPDRAKWATVEESDLVGLEALVTIGLNDSLYPRVDGVTAKPVARRAPQGVPAAGAVEAQAPGFEATVAAGVSPLRQPEAAPTALPDPTGDDDLPF